MRCDLDIYTSRAWPKGKSFPLWGGPYLSAMPRVSRHGRISRSSLRATGLRKEAVEPRFTPGHAEPITMFCIEDSMGGVFRDLRGNASTRKSWNVGLSVPVCYIWTFPTLAVLPLR